MTTQKKTRNSVAIGVGVLCAILLIAIIAIYLNYNSVLNGKDSEINSLKTQLANAGINPNPSATSNPNANDKDAVIADLQNQLAQKNSQINDLNNQVSQKSSQIDSLNSQLSQLTTQLNDANSQLTQKSSQIDSLNSQKADLQNQVNSLNAIANLQVSAIWVNQQTVSESAGGTGIAWHDWTFSANYAGYVIISVSSATAGAWTHVTYSAYGVNYNVQVNVGISGAAVFPILPSSSITVGVGNGNLVGGATQTVTITYYS